MTTCYRCGERIYYYVHSEWGPVRAGTWTIVPPDGDTDERYGTRCDRGPDVYGFGGHVPDEDEDTERTE